LQVSYLDWGNVENPNIILCVHGRLQNANDFDLFAKSFSRNYRIIAVDMVGRGRSDYFQDCKNYNQHQYASDIKLLLDQNINNRSDVGIVWVEFVHLFIHHCLILFLYSNW